MNLINMDAFSPVKVPPKKGSVVEEIAFSIGESAAKSGPMHGGKHRCYSITSSARRAALVESPVA